MIVRWFSSKNKTPRISVALDALVAIYLDEGAAQGVRGDIAFCQAVKETGYFQYGGSVKPEQNNFAGIGATSPVVGGASFPDARTGVRAQIQHLFAYAGTGATHYAVVDPRFDLVKRGVAPRWVDLNGRWAVPGVGYGESILSLYGEFGT